MTADWIEDLERKARAATPGPWSADGYGNGQQVTGATGTIFADTHASREDAEFIAEVNPAAILRLIEENRNLRTTVDADLEYQRRLVRHLEQVMAERDQWREMYQAQVHLAHVSDMKVAAVEALVSEWERVQEQNRTALGELARGATHLLLDTPGPADFRAALAAPTDATKENNR